MYLHTTLLLLFQAWTAFSVHLHVSDTTPTLKESLLTNTPTSKSSTRKQRVPSLFQSGLSSRAVGNKCGPEFGSCPTGVCCSESGWCGTEKSYCAAPNCLLDFGPGCDGNRSPGGASTADIKRVKNSDLMYGGSGIFKCKIPGTIALTYDDGPSSPHTSIILDLLEKYKAKGTFFINGNGKGRGMIDDPSTPWPAIMRRMYDAGHQVGSHTWSHQDMSKISAAQRMNQVVFNEIALNNVLGVIPTYMRPPFSSCTVDCQSLMADMGYHLTYFDLDTEDTIFSGNTVIPEGDFTGNLTTTDRRLVISHDIQLETASVLTEHMLKNIEAAGLKAVTVGECLDEPPENWYRLASGAPYVPPSSWTRYVKPALSPPPSSLPPTLPSTRSDSSRDIPGSDSIKPQVSAPLDSSIALLAPSVSVKAVVISSSTSAITSSGMNATPTIDASLISKTTLASASQVTPSTPVATNTAKSSTGAVTVPWIRIFPVSLGLACLYAA